MNHVTQKKIELFRDRLSEIFSTLIHCMVDEIRVTNQNIPHERLLTELTPWSVWFKDNNNPSTQALYSQYQVTRVCRNCANESVPHHFQQPILSLNIDALDVDGQYKANARQYSILDVLIVSQGDHISKRAYTPL